VKFWRVEAEEAHAEVVERAAALAVAAECAAAEGSTAPAVGSLRPECMEARAAVQTSVADLAPASLVKATWVAAVVLAQVRPPDAVT
jgi:hypothetical protein